MRQLPHSMQALFVLATQMSLLRSTGRPWHPVLNESNGRTVACNTSNSSQVDCLLTWPEPPVIRLQTGIG